MVIKLSAWLCVEIGLTGEVTVWRLIIVTLKGLLVFHAYINEIHGSRSKIPSKKSRQAALRGGI
jgi:hypothetical protein